MIRHDDSFGGQDYGEFTFQDIATIGGQGFVVWIFLN